MKILIVGLSPNFGGVEKIILNLCEKISGRNISFDVMVFGEQCVWENVITKNNGKVFYLPPRVKGPIRNYLAQKKFWINNSDTYNFVWIQMSSASNIVAHKLVKKYSKSKIISHSHGTNFESETRIQRHIHNFLNLVNNKKMIKFTDYFFACSEAAGLWLFGEENKENIYILNNAVDIDKYIYNEKKRKQIRADLNISEKFVITHVGRFTYVKNHELIIDIFNAVHKKWKKAFLVLVGEGDRLLQMKEKVNKLGLEEHVQFLGFADNVNEIMSGSDLFILPSHFEGFPVTLVEAQANGLKCFVSDTISKEVAVTELITFIDLNEKSERWAQLILNSSYSYERKERGYEMIEKGYDINQVSKLIKQFFETNNTEYLRCISKKEK